MVMYHYVRPPGSGLNALLLREFAAQLDHLGAAHEIVSIETYARYLHGQGTLPPRCAILTFDDGLMDHVEHVYPALQRRGMPAAFFVPTAPTEQRYLAAAHMNHLLLAAVDFDLLCERFASTLDELQPSAELRDFFDDQEALQLYHYETPPRALYKYAVAFGLPCELRDRVLKRLFTQHIGDPREWADRCYPTWDQWRGLQAGGMHVGGHSDRHEIYPRMTPAQQRQDVRQCAATLSNRLGPGQRAFAYPFGQHDDITCNEVRAAAFVAALTTRAGLNEGRVDPYRLRRVDCIHLDRYLADPTPEAQCHAC
jgi:peptidoglycan/xylan/chitin deacetylase (PgdA/CDA1 family)